MGNESLFGHIAEKFPGQIENIATESLAFILNRAKIAKEAFVKFIEQTGVKFDINLSIKTQAAGDDNITPDIVGKNASGREVLIIESKFWAGLTESQPVVYLKRFSASQNCLLLFLAPFMRFQTLWAEILRRCTKDGYRIVQIPYIGTEYWIVKINKNHTLGIVSWRALLSFILRTLETEGQIDAASDVKQLMGLCEKQDKEAFLPLSSEELCSTTGRRLVQYNHLVNKVTDKLAAKGIASLRRLRATGAENWYGRYMKIRNYGCLISCNAGYWSKFCETPLWLKVKEVKGENWLVTKGLLKALEKLSMEKPSRLFFDSTANNVPVIPLFLPTGAEEEQVIDALINQIKEIINMLMDSKL